jgi:pimeloyl-ACP methyl ester carboxylesterase
MDADDAAAEQERARLQAVADGKAAAASRPAPADDDQLQRQVQDAAPTVIDNFDNVVVKRKVNGVEELVPLADVMRTHQKTAAADQRLEEATRLLREAEARAKAVPTLVVVGDEDDHCIAPGVFLKRVVPACGLLVLPKTGHTLNLEEPAMFNQCVADFIALAEAGRWTPRDPRANAAEIMKTA